MPLPNSPTLKIDLHAIAANYRLLKARHAAHAVAAVVKANAYGLGVDAVAPALWREGCTQFFVATLEEGIQLRNLLPEAWIGVFGGLLAGEDEAFREHRLLPVLNDAGQVKRFKELRAIIHIDTGMTRLGLTTADIENLHSQLATRHSQLLLISHLACANDPAHPKNAEQLQRFQSALALLPNAQGSLANSSGLFLSPDYHFALARPGCALYGINPTEGENPMQNVARLSAPLLQIRTLDRDETIGYGATASLPKGSRVAIAGLGYADGWPRSLSNKGRAFIESISVPILGRVSMDMLALDLSAVPEHLLSPTSRAEFINDAQTVNDVATACGTIGYEVFTRIGTRVKRLYS